MPGLRPVWFALKHLAQLVSSRLNGSGDGRRRYAFPRLLILVLMVLELGCSQAYDPKYDRAVLNASEDGLSPPAAALLHEAKRHVSIRAIGAGLGGTVGAIAGVLGSRSQGGGARAGTTGAASAIGAALGYAFGDYVEARDARATLDAEELSLLVSAARKDAANYEQDLSLAETAVEESREAARTIDAAGTGTPFANDGYAQLARNLKAVSNSLQLLIRELQANQDLIHTDVQEVEANIQIGDKDLNPAPLRAQGRNLKAKQIKMIEQHRKLAAVVDTLPQRERPLIDPTPTIEATSESPDFPS